MAVNKKTSKRVSVAHIISAYKLQDNEIGDIVGKIPFLKDFTIINEVDPSIYAGFVVKYNTKVIDVSLANQLQNFKKVLYEIT